jgi:hypothetical protein
MATKRKAPYPLARNYTGEQSGKQKYLGDVKSRLMELAGSRTLIMLDACKSESCHW